MLMVILICVMCGLWAWSRRKTNKYEPPVFPGALPLIGHAHYLVGNSVQLWNNIKWLSYECVKYDGVISAYIGPRTIYVITDPEDCHTVASICLEKDNFYEFGKPWLGEGLLTGTLSIWKGHRKLLNPAFRQIVLNGFLGAFNKQSRKFVKVLEAEIGKGPFDHWAYIRRNVLETICFTVLGVDFNEKGLFNSKYVMAVEKMLNLMVERFQKFWLHNHFIYSWSSLKKNQDEYLKTLHNLSVSILQKRKADYLNNRNRTEEKVQVPGSKFKPFMDLLLELAIEEGAFNDREIREHVDTMIAAGHDTSASVLMYSVLMVGSYPDVQERVFDELQKVFGDSNRDVTKHDLPRLMYLEAVLKETMRIYPTVPVLARRLDRDVKLRNCVLTKDRTCFTFAYGVHRHAVWGLDAEEFKPERWLDPARIPVCPGAFAGFGMGRRICIGRLFAFMAMKTTLAHVFRNYKIKGDHKKLDLKLDVVLKPVSGHHISIERRETYFNKENNV